MSASTRLDDCLSKRDGHLFNVIVIDTTEFWFTGGTTNITIPSVGGHWPSNALWVFDSHMWGPRPATRDEFVAWPPRGYVPYEVIFARWSFAYPNADFSSATVSMTSGGSSVAVAQSQAVNGYGENTLVWIPLGLSDGDSWPRPASDTLYTVNIQNVKIGGQSRSFTYNVTVFDPVVH